MESDHKGYIQLYTGNGKGKTTAALGLAVRAAGAGLRIFFAQFAKGTTCAEHEALRRFGDLITVRQYGSPSFITGSPTSEDCSQGSRALVEASAAMHGGVFDVVILDEAAVAVSLNIIPLERLLEMLRQKPAHLEVIITGRNAPEGLIEVADLVTEMKEIRHYYARGVKARKGIEF